MWKAYIRQAGGQQESVSQSQTAAQSSKATRSHYYRREIGQVLLHRLKRTQSLPVFQQTNAAATTRQSHESDSSYFDGYSTEPGGIALARSRRGSQMRLFLDRKKQRAISKIRSRCFATSSADAVQWQTKYLNSRSSAHSVWSDDASQYSDINASTSTADDRRTSYTRDAPSTSETTVPLHNAKPKKNVGRLQRLLGSSHCPDDGSPFDALDSCNAEMLYSAGDVNARSKWWRGLKSRRQSNTASPTADKHSLRPWTAHEDQELHKYIDQHCTAVQIDWEKVGLRFGRSGVGCMSRYYVSKKL